MLWRLALILRLGSHSERLETGGYQDDENVDRESKPSVLGWRIPHLVVPARKRIHIAWLTLLHHTSGPFPWTARANDHTVCESVIGDEPMTLLLARHQSRERY